MTLFYVEQTVTPPPANGPGPDAIMRRPDGTAAFPRTDHWFGQT